MDHKFAYVSSGQFATMCNINKKTLFHYEEIGLFSPAYVNEKGYRYYSLSQLDVFSIISILKDLGVPLKKIKEYLDKRTPKLILDLSREKILEVENEISKLQKVKHVLEETIDYTQRGLNSWKSEVRLEEHEEETLILSQRIKDSDRQSDINWMNFFKKFESQTQSKDTSFVGAMITKVNVLEKKYGSKYYLFAKTKNPSHGIQVYVKPKGTFAVTFHHGSYETIGLTYQNIINFLNENNMVMGEYVFEEYLIDEVAVQKDNDFITQITVQCFSKTRDTLLT
ncbi:DNA-binding transcriptional MerR regulator [Fontibacillus solani]|uniref:DNA-binding transcriptional MerR regulator n=1 Tax=Fontibacillus solani TaxID=1572857 RepID=A0A7W3XTS9_9BACL|nr:MerR family transcriptional regulator [Fontibacillus solani]MBA9087921.1 DNA-binding transcriptional MerR regulator [Fontibacillus solani]